MTRLERLEKMLPKDRESDHDHMNAHICKGGDIGYWDPCPICGSGEKRYTRKQVIEIVKKLLKGTHHAS